MSLIARSASEKDLKKLLICDNSLVIFGKYNKEVLAQIQITYFSSAATGI